MKQKRKIRVCHIVSGDVWAGAEAQVFTLLRGIASGRDVELVVVTFNEGKLTERLIQNHIKTLVIREDTNTFVKLVRCIYKILRKEQIEIIHVHGYKETLAGGLASKLGMSIPIVRTCHGKGLFEASMFYRLIEKLNACFCRKIISVSHELKIVLDKYYRDSSIEVIHNCIDCQQITIRKSASLMKSEFGIPDEAFVIGTMGRLVNVKGHLFLLKIIRKIVESKENVYFIIAGDGPLKQKLQVIANDEGISDKVKFVGFISDPFDLLNMFDVFVLTSLHEGVPMVLLEAMCLNLAIVATNVGGIPEVISDRNNGILVESMDLEGFREACLELMDNSALRAKMGIVGREIVEKKFKVDSMVSRVTELYREML